MLVQEPVRTPVASVAASPVGRVQDTARWVAMARALESERRDAVFEDRLEVDHADVIAEEACLSDSATACRVERVPQDLSIASEREPRRSEAR